MILLIQLAMAQPNSTTGNYVKELTEAGAIHRNGSGWKVLQ